MELGKHTLRIAQLQRTSDRIGVIDNLYLTGFIEESHQEDLYHHADAGVLPHIVLSGLDTALAGNNTQIADAVLVCPGTVNHLAEINR